AVNVPVSFGRKAVSRIEVNGDLLVTDFNVALTVTHTADRDLVITLVAPDGTRIMLANRRGGLGDNYAGTRFDDEAGTPIAEGSPPFAGSFRPEQGLAALDGRPARGTWTLEVEDFGLLFRGTLVSWALTFTGVPLTTGVTSVSSAESV